MKDVTIILLAGGISQRFNAEINKVYANLNQKTVIEHSLDKFIKIDEVDKIIISYNQKDEQLLNNILANYDFNIEKVIGGNTRSESLNKALDLVKTAKLLIHDAARPYTNILDIEEEIKALDEADVVTLYHNPVDAVKVGNSHISKTDVYLVSTPQGIKTKYIDILKNGNINREDDLEPFENQNVKIKYIKESSSNLKITYLDDLNNNIYKVGHSFDFHKLEIGKELYLGGLKIDSPFGLLAHSDGDVLLHAITEAMLGILNIGDLGDNYPDNDDSYKNISSTFFLNDVYQKLIKEGYVIQNIDCMIYLEKPKLKNYKRLIEQSIGKLLNIDPIKISVKATTLEKQGAIGLSEGIAASAYVLVTKNGIN